MNERVSRRPASLLAALAAAIALVAVSGDVPVEGAQRGQRGAGPAQPVAGRAGAPIDPTGYWVSIISEDWRLRMVTPPKGDYLNVPLTQEGRRVADSWDPDRDEKEGQQCRVYGAAGVMRLPTRLHITWENDATLRIDTDAGQQTRRLQFGPAPQSRERTWQGHSVASWEFLRGRAARDPAGQPAAVGVSPVEAARRAADVAEGRGGAGGSLKVVTTNLRAGYLRRNGVPYSEGAVLTEWFDRHTDLGADYILHTRIVEDPVYLNQPYIVTSHFRKEPDASKWNPTACEVIRAVQF